jgi:N-carbamoylputrescine amidase
VNDTVTVGLVQMSPSEDREASLRMACDMARDARAHGAELIAFPELFTGPFFARTLDPEQLSLAEPVPGPTTEVLAGLAAELGAVVVGSLFEEVEPGFCFNTAVVFERDGTFLGRSRKMHIPHCSSYHDKFYFTPGDTDYPVFETSLLNLAVLTCWDQWFPEAARIAFLKGAELIVYPTALALEASIEPSYFNAWETVMRGHAIANTLYVAAVNRVGREGEMDFRGGSFVCDPEGVILERGDDEERIVCAELSSKRLRDMRTVNQFLRDRRPETYGPLLRRTCRA